jgi:hypothetical protein
LTSHISLPLALRRDAEGRVQQGGVASVRLTLLTLSGPLLVIVIVWVSLVPGTTLVLPSSTVIEVDTAGYFVFTQR